MPEPKKLDPVDLSSTVEQIRSLFGGFEEPEATPETMDVGGLGSVFSAVAPQIVDALIGDTGPESVAISPVFGFGLKPEDVRALYGMQQQEVQHKRELEQRQREQTQKALESAKDREQEVKLVKLQHKMQKDLREFEIPLNIVEKYLSGEYTFPDFMKRLQASTRADIAKDVAGTVVETAAAEHLLPLQTEAEMKIRATPTTSRSFSAHQNILSQTEIDALSAGAELDKARAKQIKVGMRSPTPVVTQDNVVLTYPDGRVVTHPLLKQPSQMTSKEVADQIATVYAIQVDAGYEPSYTQTFGEVSGRLQALGAPAPDMEHLRKKIEAAGGSGGRKKALESVINWNENYGLDVVETTE